MTGWGHRGPDREAGHRGLGVARGGSTPHDLGHRSGLSARGAGAIAGLLALLLCTCAVLPAVGQSTAVAAVAPGRVIERLFVSADVQATWERVVACAGELRDTSKTLDQVVFLLRTAGKRLPNATLIKGEWVAPDTIFVTQGYEHSGWIVAHELLHHALNGPPGTIKHPLSPFLYPCGLWHDPTSEVPDSSAVLPADVLLGGPHFAYPVLGFAVYIQGTLLAGHGWWRA